MKIDKDYHNDLLRSKNRTDKCNRYFKDYSNLIPLSNICFDSNERIENLIARSPGTYKQAEESIFKSMSGIKASGKFIPVNPFSIERHPRGMNYDTLNRRFFKFMYETFSKLNDYDVKISIDAGSIYEKTPGNPVRLLATVVAKVEWIPDILYRMHMGLKLNPKSLGIIEVADLDTADYHYQGFRNNYRKEIKPYFEDRVIIVDSIEDTFTKDIKLPAFLLQEEKDKWDEEMSKEFFKSVADDVKPKATTEEPQPMSESEALDALSSGPTEITVGGDVYIAMDPRDVNVSDSYF